MKSKEINELNQSMYCYPGTSVLINKKGIRDKEELLKLENVLVTYKLARLIQGEKPFIRDLSINHYLNIHKYLFGDLYPFAAELRKEFTNKSNEEIEGEEGLRIYCDPPYIYECLNERLNMMKNQARKIYTREGLIKFLSTNYMELYYIHPFREGNSRTLREFMREYVELMNEKLIRFGNFEIDYTKLDNVENKNFIKAVIWNTSNDQEKQKQSMKLLYDCFDKCLIEKKIDETEKSR
ncbi:MAG: Fic family protein [Bacilli bacterium]|nr:Fic family protein [Bacilli bacterium]